MPNTAPGGSWDFIILALSAYVVFEIIFELIYGSDNELYSFLQIGDNIACVFFFIDVMWRWCASQNKLGFWKWGWIDLIASIPTLDGLRWARMFRVFRIFRIVRGMRSAERVIEYFFKDRAKSTAAVALTILFGSVLISGVLVLQAEAGVGNIRDASDAFWWAMETVTTVGYGDKYPVTAAGRIVGVCLMVVGISLFGATSALLANWLLHGRMDDMQNSGNADTKRLEEAILRLEEQVKNLRFGRCESNNTPNNSSRDIKK